MNKTARFWKRRNTFSFPAQILKHTRGSYGVKASHFLLWDPWNARTVNSRTWIDRTGSIKAHQSPGSETALKVIYICNLFKNGFSKYISNESLSRTFMNKSLSFPRLLQNNFYCIKSLHSLIYTNTYSQQPATLTHNEQLQHFIPLQQILQKEDF